MLRISLLGEQTIGDDVTGQIRSRSSRSLALVGYLAIHAETPQSRQLIAGLFWPDSTEAQAFTNLRRELHHLRHVLDEDASLEVTATDLCWHDTASSRVDVRVLLTSHKLAHDDRIAHGSSALARHAVEGIAAYGGDFLPSVYEDWAVEARDQLRRTCVELCDLLTGTEQGDLRVRVDAARRRIALEPFEEVGYRVLMGLQMEMGDRGGAISTYHHCASVLERELGVAPDPESRRALDRLIGRTETREGPETPQDQDQGQDQGLRRSGIGGTALIGRTATLKALVDHWESTVLHERAQVVVVAGDAGVGKTRVVAELAERVRASQGSVAATQCFDSSGRLALAPVADWLRTPELRAASRALDPVWRQEVERLMPEIGNLPPSPPSGGRAMVDAWQRHRFFEGLAQAFLAVHRPLLLVLDNLQWCDEETFAWISFLLGLAPHNRLMLAMTLRKDEETSYPTAGDWVARLRTGHLVEEIQLGPLDREETATLSAAVTGRALPEDEQVLLHGTTGGFPLYVIEAAQAASGEGFAVRPSEQLGTVLRRRIGQTSRHAQETAGLAAALGSDFTIDVLTEASDLDADTVARSVDELWRRRILRELGSGYDFSHDLLRDAAYEMVSPPRRWLLHRRLAQALELSASGQDESLAGLLAEQYDRGGRPDRALSHYTRAAEVAAGRFASADAIRLHRHALRIIEAQPAGPHRDQQELECLLALAAPLNALHGYASTELRTVLERAVRLAERSGSSRLLVTSLVGLWASRYVQGEILDSLRLVSRALSVSEVDDVLLGEAHFGFAGSAVTLGRPAEAVEHFDQAHDRCRGAESLAVGTMPEVHALAWAAHAHWLLGQWDEAASRADEAVSRARAFAHPYSLAVALAYAAVTEQLLDDRVALGKRVRELDGLSDRYGFAYYREWGLVLGGWLHGGPDGLARAKRGIENLRGQCSLARMPYWLSLQADLMIDCGMTEAAIATLDAARTGAVLRGDAWWLPEVQRVRAGLSAPGMREELLKSALELAERQGSRALADRCRRDLGPAAGMSETPFVTGPSRANAEGTLPS